MTPKWIDPKKCMPLPDSKVKMLIHFDGYRNPEDEWFHSRDTLETGYWADKLWMDDETVPVEDDENKVIQWMYL
jgi:hypothetical protein